MAMRLGVVAPKEKIVDNEFFDDDDYEMDSPEAVLRCAVAVACCDGEFAYDEQDKVRSVYADICQEMTFAYNRPDVSDDYEKISKTTAEFVLTLDDGQKRDDYITYCGESITDKDLRELTLVMALRVAGADAELAKAEFRALKKLASRWEMRLSDILAPYLAIMHEARSRS